MQGGGQRTPDGAARGVAQVMHLVQHDEPHVPQPLLRLPRLPRLAYTPQPTDMHAPHSAAGNSHCAAGTSQSDSMPAYKLVLLKL